MAKPEEVLVVENDAGEVTYWGCDVAVLVCVVDAGRTVVMRNIRPLANRLASCVLTMHLENN